MFKKIMLAFLISSCMSVVSLADESILTLEEIQNAITEKGLHWSAGKTSVSDLSMEEKKGLCGLVIPPEVESDISRVNKEPEATLSKFGQQTRWDWREHSGVTAVKDQKSCASCWAFAAIGALESAVKISPPHTELDLSEQQVVSCNTWGGTCAGGWPESAYELFRDYGAIDESNMPYQSSDTVACTQNSWEPLVKIEAWSHFIPNNVNDIKNALATGPITSSMTIYQDLYSYTSGCYVHASGGLVAKHEVLIIGWDDALCGGQGGWIVKNSWGTSWGEGGFFNIRYGNCNIGDGGQLVEYPALFYGKIDYGAGASPRSPFFADLDGDSDLDLVVTNGDMKVSILKNNGNGTFQAPVKYGVGYDPHSVFCADLDGDGDLDLAVANFLSSPSWNVSILKNNGDGTFQTAVNYGAGQSAWCVFCADLDGDGDLDLAVTNRSGNNVSILKNNGDGTFQTAVNYGAGNVPSSVFCADLDGDGDLDLAVSNADSNVSILKNNGNGTFQAPVKYYTGGAGVQFCADLDGDGDLDLAGADYYGGAVSILKNNGNGTFQAPVKYAGGLGYYVGGITCGDLDGDGDLDLAVESQTNTRGPILSILKNNGDGTFQTAVNYSTGGTVGICRFPGDLDGHGDLDLAVAVTGDTVVGIFLNRTSEYTDVNEGKYNEKVGTFSLDQNYPNPFNQATKIEFTLQHPSLVNLNIYDVLGRKVRTLIFKDLSSGYKSVLWDGKDNSGNDVASGVYFYQLKVKDFSQTKKMVLIK